MSPWVGHLEKLTLKDFVDKELASCGANISEANKAMEIAFWHANNEIYSPSDGGEPVSIIFVVGDVPANTKEEIMRLKYRCPETFDDSITDEMAKSLYGYNKGWSDTLQAKYGESTTWEAQLEKIRSFEDKEGFKIPVKSFYVTTDNKVNHSLEDFYSKLDVNSYLEDRGRLLKLNDKMSLIYSLCVMTMNMIADKNPEGPF